MNQKITFTLKRKELMDLGNVFHDAQTSEVDFTKVRDRKIRKMLATNIQARHKLWLKIVRIGEVR